MRKTPISYLAMAAACLIASPSWAQISNSEDRLQEFKEAHPQVRFFGKQYFDDEGFFEQVGTADTMFGAVMATGENPIDSAKKLCTEMEGMYVEEAGSLVPAVGANGQVVQGAMWNKATQTHRFSTFRFNQTIAGVPVFRSGIGFLVRNEDQFPVVMASNNLKELNGFDAADAAFVLPKATPDMIANTAKMMDTAGPFQGAQKRTSVLNGAKQEEALPVRVSEERLVIWAGVTNVRVAPEMAIVFMAERGDDISNQQKHLVVAAVDDGAVLYSENQIVADVDGTVSGRSTDSDRALECDPEVAFALPYAEVEILGGQTVFADVNGNFNIPDGTTGNVTVRSPLRGQFFEVFDDTAGGSTPFIDINVAAPGSVDFLHNPSATEFATSNVNTYIHANIVRDYVLSFEPSYPVIGGQTFFDITSNNDNISGITSCNATYNGSQINFMRNIGACNNTSIPDVVYHEYGHHLVNVTGNGQGQFGEGSGDTIGVLIEDDPDLALGFFEGDCNNGIRSANNFRTYPCNGAIHDCGQLISGCVWDFRNELGTVDPTNAVNIASELFIGMLIVRGQMVPGNSTIDPLITIIFLELDDDDGFIGNGTPHYQQVADAFNPHNMTAPELELIEISFPEGLPENINPNGGVEFEVSVDSISADPADGTGVLHVNRGSGFEQFPMVQTSPTTYAAEFPTSDCGSIVSFFVSVDADNGSTVTRPAEAPGTSFNALSASSATVAFIDSFDTNLGWTVSGDATDGQWQRGVPTNGDRGDPAVDAEEDGAGLCFVTDNDNAGSTNSDVDGGSTILTSPIMDASAGAEEIPFISYYRWYSNDEGASPNADIFVVEISNDGGSTWVNLETVGPTGPDVSGGWIFQQFRISDFVTPTDQMRIRFNASDLGDGSVVEAGVDAVQVQIIGCGDEFVPGDVNGDGEVNLLDVGPFVDLIATGQFQEEADLNNDGAVNLLDVQLFVNLLSGG